jgi:hypothetical protein
MTNMEDADLYAAPGCFGMAMGFTEDGMECKGCRYRETCAEESVKALAKLQAELGVVPEVKQKAKPPKPKAEPKGLVVQVVREGMPMKVKQIAERLQNRGIDLAGSLRQGINPIDDTPGFLRVACDLLLKGGFTRHSLRAAFMTAFAWSYGTAAAHVGQVFSLMTTLEVAVESNERLQMRQG